MDVSIIMINYNTFDLAKDAIESIFNYSKNFDYELVLIDNASPDKSGEKLNNFFGEKIKYISSNVNLGTSKAFNLAIKECSGKYVLWINPDIIIKENFIYTLFEYMENNPDVGVCGGNVLDFEGKPHHSYMRKLPSFSTVKAEYNYIERAIKRLFKKKRSFQYNYLEKPIDVGYITGADIFIRSELFSNIGNFDENIFMYAEETEFCFRVKTQTNYKIMSVPFAHIYHLEGASFTSSENKFNLKKYEIYNKGFMYYIKKCYGAKELKRIISFLCKKNNQKSFFARLLNKKDIVLECKEKNRVLNEILLEYM